jgi:hypothetical protein
VDSNRTVAILQRLQAELWELKPPAPSAELMEWKKRTELALRRVFGSDHHLVSELKGVEFLHSYARTDDDFRRSFEYGRAEATALLKAAIYDLEVLSQPTDFASSESIDPELWEHVRRLVEQEQWGQVASQTAIFLESKIRQWAALPTSKYGQDLMASVLRPGGDAFPLGQTAGEQQGWLSFGIGFASGVGNAARHRIERRDDDKRFAIGVLGAGSLLLTQLRYEHGNRFKV